MIDTQNGTIGFHSSLNVTHSSIPEASWSRLSRHCLCAASSRGGTQVKTMCEAQNCVDSSTLRRTTELLNEGVGGAEGEGGGEQRKEEG